MDWSSAVQHFYNDSMRPLHNSTMNEQVIIYLTMNEQVITYLTMNEQVIIYPSLDTLTTHLITTVINEHDQLQLNGIPYYQEHWHFGPNLILQPKYLPFSYLAFFTLCRSFTVISSHFWHKKQFIQGNWHNFTEEWRNPFQVTPQAMWESCV